MCHWSRRPRRSFPWKPLAAALKLKPGARLRRIVCSTIGGLDAQISRAAVMIVGQIIGGKKLELDLPKLVDTRLLIQANSGGGKSWLLRLIAERAGIQTIVLDNEGEFASLR